MHALIADDDAVSCQVLKHALVEWGYEVAVVRDGAEALDALQRNEKIQLAILDWMMPGSDGIEVCRKVKELSARSPLYIILLTTKGNKEDLIEGLEAGADDYITKPFDFDELRARLKAGERIVRLESELAHRVWELESTHAHLKNLQGLLPICSYCKRIRDDKDYWHQVEHYIAAHSEAMFSHSICPDCYKKEIKPQLDEIKGRSGA
jgi:DNA-binding response OmpR family regulator